MMREKFYLLQRWRLLGAVFVLVVGLGQANAQCTLTSNLTVGKSTICPGDSTMLTYEVSDTSKNLTSTINGGNRHNGNMFMVTAQKDLYITHFDINIPATKGDFAVAYRTGGFAGNEGSVAGWTVIDTATITGNGVGTLTRLPIYFRLQLKKGDTMSFYVTSITSTVYLEYTNGTTRGDSLTSDSGLIFYEGIGMEYPFGNSGGYFSPRIWNGKIHWDEGAPTILRSTGASTRSIWVDPLQKTQYWAKGTAGPCTVADTLDVDVQYLTPVVRDSTYCAGTSVVMDAGAPANVTSYSWDKSATAAGRYALYKTPGTKWVDVRSAIGCTVRDSFVIAEIQTPTPGIGKDTAFCDGNTLTLDAGSYGPTATYDWTGTTLASTQTLAVTGSGTYKVTVEEEGCIGNDEIVVVVHKNPSVSLGADVEICDGDSATFDAGIHSNSDVYSWSGGSTMQTAAFDKTGDYAATVTDENGCSTTDSVNLTVNSLPAVDLGADQDICDGDPNEVDGGDFGAGTTWKWSNSETTQKINVAASGTYVVVVTTGKGCVGSDTMDFTVRPTPTVDLKDSLDLCDGASMTLDPGTQSTGSTYEWNDSSTDPTLGISAGGTYSVIVTNAEGCSNNDDVIVHDRDLPIVDLGPDTDVCHGSTIELDAGSHASVVWSNTLTTQKITVRDGTYGVTVTNEYGCEASDEIVIDKFPSAFANFIGSNQGEFRIQFSNFSSNGDTYEWDFGDGNSSTDETPRHTYDKEGSYEVELTVTNKCGSHTAKKTINVSPASIGGSPISGSFNMFPNPNAGNFTIEMQSAFENVYVEVISVTGKVMMTEQIGSVDNGMMHQVQLTNTQPGVYFLRFNADGQIGTAMMTVQ